MPPTNFDLDRMTSQKRSLAIKYSFKLAASEVEFQASFKMNFYQKAGEWLSPRLQAVGGDKKFFGVIFCFKSQPLI